MINTIKKLKLSLIALVFALLISALIMVICGYNPLLAYAAIWQGAFGGRAELFQTFVQATPLIFSGLAFTFAKKATLMNLGIEGQLYFGALGAAVIGSMDLGLPQIVHLPLAIFAGMVLGALLGGLIGVLKVRFGSNEVISSMMLNSIAALFIEYVTNGPLKAKESSVAQTQRVVSAAELPRLVSRYQLTIAVFIAVAACVLVKWLIDKTILGYEIRSVGLNQSAAETAGIRTKKVMVIAMLISGAIAGLAGSCHVLGVDRRLICDFSPGYGFDGIAVAALAADSPIAVIFAGVVFGALRAGCMLLSRTTNIPRDFVSVIQALVILFVAAPLLMKDILKHRNLRVCGRKEMIANE